MSQGACILAIGNEITSGEVINSNASWLGQKLEATGFMVSCHMAVPDDRKSILDALKFLEARSDLIVITGGLGPTTDDLTREIVAEWLESPLEFNTEIWSELQALIEFRGLPVREAHRRQCYFPRGSEVLRNPVGTAHGFLTGKQNYSVLVLPGPPGELKGVFAQDKVTEALAKIRPRASPELLVWTLFGVPESEAAEVTEDVMKGSGLTLGYRASLPYVRVKVWVPRAETKRGQWIESLHKALEPWTIGFGANYDPIDKLVEGILRRDGVVIFDEVSEGRLALRLNSAEPRGKKFNLIVHSAWSGGLSVEQLRRFREKSLRLDIKSTFLWLGRSEAGEFVLGLRDDFSRPLTFEIPISLPYKIPVTSKRAKEFAAEFSILTWGEKLSGTGLVKS